MSDDGIKLYCDKPGCIAHGVRAMKKNRLARRKTERQPKEGDRA